MMRRSIEPRGGHASEQHGTDDHAIGAETTLRVTVRFAEVKRVRAKRGGDSSFALYELLCSEGNQEWRSLVRWSDLTRMWDDLRLFHRNFVRGASDIGTLPTIRRHSRWYSKVDGSLCMQRVRCVVDAH